MAVTDPDARAAPARDADHRPRRHAGGRDRARGPDHGPSRARLDDALRGDATRTFESRSRTRSARWAMASGSRRSDSARVASTTSCAGSARCSAPSSSCARYALEREAFGGPLADKQTVQNWIADSAAEIQACRLMTLDAAHKIDQGSEARVEVSLIKFYAARVLNDVIDRAVQVHGARGLTDRDAARAECSRWRGPRGSTTAPTRCTAWSSPAGSSSRSQQATAGGSTRHAPGAR